MQQITETCNEVYLFTVFDLLACMMKMLREVWSYFLMKKYSEEWAHTSVSAQKKNCKKSK